MAECDVRKLPFDYGGFWPSRTAHRAAAADFRPGTSAGADTAEGRQVANCCRWASNERHRITTRCRCLASQKAAAMGLSQQLVMVEPTEADAEEPCDAIAEAGYRVVPLRAATVSRREG